MRHAAVASLVALAGCGSFGVPGLGVLPAFEAEVEDRVWRADDPAVAPGPIVAFLSDGTMLTAACDGGYALAPWRRVDAATLAWEAPGGVVRAEIAALGPRELALLVDPDGAATPATYRRVEAPNACP